MKSPKLIWLATVWLIAGIVLSGLAHANTYYVRTDGGTATQCDGTANAAASAAPHCAWSSPLVVLPPSVAPNYVRAALIKGGDTLNIASGSYMIGYSAAMGSMNPGICYTQAEYACVMQPVPSGPDAQHPTVIQGDCSAPPVLWGTEGATQVVSLDGSSNVSVQCLEVTDHSPCIVFYSPDPKGACSRSWGTDVGTWAATGIHAQDSSNVTLANLNIHGLAGNGVNAGRLTNWTVGHVTIRGNGSSGWNGDLGGNDHTSTNAGALNFDHLIVDYSGCTENYPTTTIINCWGQNEGGYGDGFAEAWTGGNWTFTNSSFSHNAQDGLDLLYANGTGTILLSQVQASRNAGNQVKTSGNAVLQRSVINGQCNDFKPPMPLAGDGSSGVSGTMCRADGVAVVMEFNAPNQTATVSYSTITGNGDALFNGGADTYTPVASDVTLLSNSIWLGQTSVLPRDDGNYAALDFYSDGTYNGTVQYKNNVIWHVKDNKCPAGSICKDPLLKGESMAAFDPTKLPGSPATGACVGAPPPGTTLTCKGN